MLTLYSWIKPLITDKEFLVLKEFVGQDSEGHFYLRDIEKARKSTGFGYKRLVKLVEDLEAYALWFEYVAWELEVKRGLQEVS